jgi:hypothetical protein
MSQHSYEKKDTFTVKVQLKSYFQKVYHGAVNTYEKGSFYCIEDLNGKVYKYPINDIWRVERDTKSSSEEESFSSPEEQSLEEAFNEVSDNTE